jgi:hypothetical protein
MKKAFPSLTLLGTLVCAATSSYAADLSKDEIHALVVAEEKVYDNVVQLHNIDANSMLPATPARTAFVKNWQEAEKNFSVLCQADALCKPGSPEQGDETVLQEQLGSIRAYLENPSKYRRRTSAYKANLSRIAKAYIKLSKDLTRDQPSAEEDLRTDLESNAALIEEFVQ